MRRGKAHHSDLPTMACFQDWAPRATARRGFKIRLEHFSSFWIALVLSLLVIGGLYGLLRLAVVQLERGS